MTPEEQKAYNRKYYLANKAHIRAVNKAWANAHPNFSKEYNSSYYQRNKETHRAATREWECRNRDKVLERHRKRRSNPEYLEKERLDARKRYQEHPERWAAAGRKWIKKNPDWPKNLQWLCASCNCSKGARDEVEFMQSRGRLL